MYLPAQGPRFHYQQYMYQLVCTSTKTRNVKDMLMKASHHWYILVLSKYVSSQIHLISPGCPRPNSALTVRKSGLEHRSSIHPEQIHVRFVTKSQHIILPLQLRLDCAITGIHNSKYAPVWETKILGTYYEGKPPLFLFGPEPVSSDFVINETRAACIFPQRVLYMGWWSLKWSDMMSLVFRVLTVCRFGFSCVAVLIY